MKPTALPIFLFAGPTVFHLPPNRLSSFPLIGMPPVENGSIDALIDTTSDPGEIILVDGILSAGERLAPAEINRALSMGWQFWGLASMGALLAARMKTPGMRGFGVVFRQFLLERSLTRDEIALLHSPVSPYTPHSEPLIHLRLLMRHLEVTGLVSPGAASAILSHLEGAPLENRTLSNLSELLIGKGGLTAEQSSGAIAEIPRFRAKNNDLDRFLGFRFRRDSTLRRRIFVGSPSEKAFVA